MWQLSKMIISLSTLVEGMKASRKKKASLAWKLPPTAWKCYTAVEVKNPATRDLPNKTEKKKMGLFFKGVGA